MLWRKPNPLLTLNDILAGHRVFIDANIFVYHFTGASSQCTTLLEKCERGEVEGVTSAYVLAEAAHREMTTEAVKRNLIAKNHPVKQLKDKPEVVRQLSATLTAQHLMRKLPLTIVPLSPEIFWASELYRERYGFLTGDSIIMASLRQEGLTHLATADRAFERVSDVKVYAPTDLSF